MSLFAFDCWSAVTARELRSLAFTPVLSGSTAAGGFCALPTETPPRRIALRARTVANGFKLMPPFYKWVIKYQRTSTETGTPNNQAIP